jgi:hypothetical protein
MQATDASWYEVSILRGCIARKKGQGYQRESFIFPQAVLPNNKYNENNSSGW